MFKLQWKYIKNKLLKVSRIQEEEKLRLDFLHNFNVRVTINIPKTHNSYKRLLKHECSCFDLIESLKFLVQDRTGIPVESIEFFIWDMPIPDNVILYDVGPWQEISITTKFIRRVNL